MKNHLLIALLLTTIISSPKNETPLPKDDLATYVIATYNVTHGKKNNWDKRKPGVINTIKGLNADILCIQEAIKEKDQLSSIQQASHDYDYVGEPRSSGITSDVSLLNRIKYWFVMTGIPYITKRAEDEYCPIFFNKNKFDLIETETVSINGNGSAFLPRICTRARLRPKNTEKLFDVYNTHLDNYEQKDRLMQLGFVIKEINRHSKDIPAILAGDFNTEITDDIKSILATGQLTPAKECSKIIQGEKGTHKLKDKKTNKPIDELTEIDHIIIKPKNAFIVEQYKTPNTMSDTTSDHNPVSMKFSLKE